MITATLVAMILRRLSWTGRGLLALVLGCAIAMDGSTPVQARQASGAVHGLWRTPVDGGGAVQITPCGTSICGQIVSSPRLRANPDQRDVRNADPARRSRRLAGLRILQAHPQGDGRWGDGWVYNPEDGKTYRGSLQLDGDRLRLTGCVVRPFCKTQTWTRIGD